MIQIRTIFYINYNTIIIIFQTFIYLVFWWGLEIHKNNHYLHFFHRKWPRLMKKGCMDGTGICFEKIEHLRRKILAHLNTLAMFQLKSHLPTPTFFYASVSPHVFLRHLAVIADYTILFMSQPLPMDAQCALHVYN